ncbi:MAG: phytoene desaturase [Sphingobacteriia bacterium]|nr:MAG: phytoene desaturase [Sphingobacteriia bacterium]
MNNSPRQAFIVGAGIAGIAAAIRLRLQGFEVTVYEKNEYPGGKLSSFKKGDYHFDAGPSLFTRPALVAELFEAAGEPMEAYFSFEHLPISCNYFYEDGTTLKAYADRTDFANELSQKLGEPAQHIHHYLNRSALTYKHIGELFLNFSLHKIATLFTRKMLKAIQYTRLSFLFKSLNSYNEQKFQSPKTVQLFNRYATYNGSNPYKAPAMLSLIPHLEHNEGLFYPKGGMINITNALYSLALKQGVVFKLNTKVDKIIRSGGEVKGVVVGGNNYHCDLVVSNMDIYFTYKILLDEPEKAQKILLQERSSSAFIFYWGIAAEFGQLGLHNIFFAEDYKKEFEFLFETGQAYHDPTVYINITAKCEPGIHAPAGKENWFVMVNAPANKGQDWETIRTLYRSAIIKKISKALGCDIEPLIETEELLSPVGIELKTASYMGSLYGTSSNNRNAAFLRHPNYSKTLKGLYFVGGSVHPGGGIPLCLSSAKIMADLIKADRHSSFKK